MDGSVHCGHNDLQIALSHFLFVCGTAVMEVGANMAMPDEQILAGGPWSRRVAGLAVELVDTA